MRKLMMALVILSAIPAIASTSAIATVSNLHFMPGGPVLFNTSVARADVPPCAAGLTTRWAIDTNTSAGKAQLAGLLTAHSTGKKVSVIGTNNCDVWADTESVSYLVVH